MKKVLTFGGLFIVGLFAGRGLLLTIATSPLEKEVKLQQATIDSLRDENFELNVELNRDDLSFEFLQERDSIIWKEVIEYRAHETE